MPTYDYKCDDCGKSYEYFQSMSDEPITVCPDCSGSLKRLIGGGLGIIFKGSGFYVTDNKGRNSNNGASKTGAADKAVKSETTPAKKKEPKKETAKAST